MPTDALDALLAPLSAAEFFARFWERAPLHLPAVGRCATPLVTHAELVDALSAAFAARGEPPDGLMVFPEHLGEGSLGAADLLADRDLFRAYLDAGHPVAWNRPRGAFPAVDALSAALAEAFGAHVWPNVYATGAAGTPFGMHFDCHEVIAVHAEGAKDWTISEVRIDRPLDADAMAPTIRAVMQARQADAEARPALRFTAHPGDVIYIPRGQFHHAEAAPGSRSLHVTFGVRLLTGHDVAALLARLALALPGLREYLPPRAADPEGARARAHLTEVRELLAALLGDASLDDAVAEARAHAVARSRA
jgi:hypothetical protein